MTELGGLHRKMVKLDIFLIDYEIVKANHKWWLDILEIFLKPGLRVKASIDRNQTDILEKLSTYYNDLKIAKEKNQIYFEGILNREMIKDFKESYKVKNDDGMDYYSPFIRLEIGDNYCSAHYGREVYLTNLSEVELGDVLKVLNPLRESFKIDIS